MLRVHLKVVMTLCMIALGEEYPEILCTILPTSVLVWNHFKISLKQSCYRKITGKQL